MKHYLLLLSVLASSMAACGSDDDVKKSAVSAIVAEQASGTSTDESEKLCNGPYGAEDQLRLATICNK